MKFRFPRLPWSHRDGSDRRTSGENTKVAQPAMPGFMELSDADNSQLDGQRALIAASVERHYGTTSLTGTKADLPVLQRVLDDRVFSETHTYELQCLGVVFGDVLVDELPLRWMIVTDEYGTDPTLRFGNTTIQINALTMISKRIERGEAVDLSALLLQTGAQLAAIAKGTRP